LRVRRTAGIGMHRRATTRKRLSAWLTSAQAFFT
jgi:hypothetical protein